MASQPLVLSDPNLLAEFVRESEFKAFFEKRFATPPDIAALIFKNGELIDSFKGAHFSVGGLANALKSVVGGSTHIALMLADLKPFQVKLPLKALSRDNVEIVGLATLELQLNPDKPTNILGLMGGVSRQQVDKNTGDVPITGRKALSKNDVLERIAPHFTDRVVEAIIGRMDATEIRGETQLQDKIQADMMLEAERVCGHIGILVNAVSAEWAMNAAEREAFERANISRQQDAMDFQLDLLKREIDRKHDATEFKINATTDLKKIRTASEDELRLMVLNSEVTFIDARNEATRRQEMQALAHEIEVLRTERAAKMEGEITEAGHLSNLTKEAARMRALERDIERLDRKHTNEMKKSGALTDIEIDERRQRMELSIAAIAQAQSQKNLAALMDMEQDALDRGSDRTIREKRTDTEGHVAQLQAGAKMTPEQILAINASLSADVADVLKEQARAQGLSGEQAMTAMRDMANNMAAQQERSRQHELDILKAGMAGATGVAHGAGGKTGRGDGLDPSSATVECPECGRILKAKSKYCTGCGHKMRT